MAYRKTEKVLAQIEARRAGILAAAIDTIAKNGMDGFSTDTVAKRAEVSIGLIYNYYPDARELKEAVTAHLLARDIAAIKAGIGTRRGREALAHGLGVLVSRLAQKRRLMMAVAATEAYRSGMKAELARLIRAAETDGEPSLQCAVVFGAVFEATRSMRAKDEPALLAALLRALGVTAKRRALA